MPEGTTPESTVASSESRNEPGPRSSRLAFAIFFVPYAAFMLLSLPDYGAIWDVSYEFPRATAYLSHALGEETPSRASPWHLLSYEQARSSHGGSVNGCLPSLIAASTGKIFYEWLGLLDYVDAYHLGLVLLWLLFVVHFHSRLSVLHGGRMALVAVVLLALIPRVVGHVPNNMKDIPALAFGAAALLELAVALTRGRPRGVYLAALLFACAVSSKFVAAIVAVPAVVLVYLALRDGGFVRGRRGAYVLPFASVPVLSAIVLIGHWPYFWVPAGELWGRVVLLFPYLGKSAGFGPSLYPVAMAIMTTPILVLAGLLGAGVASFWKPAATQTERALLSFYSVWVLSVLAVFSSGVIAMFDGIRHFLLFIPPVAVLSAWGILRASDAVLERIAGFRADVQWPKRLLVPVVALLCAVPILRYHPYEVTYFNGLVGGLPGATEIQFGDNVDYEPRDYWGTSIRHAVNWANQNLPSGAAVWISLPLDFSDLYRLRSDVRYVAPADWKGQRPYYLIFLNRKNWLGDLEEYAIRHGKLVHREEAQGVPLAFVYRIAPRARPRHRDSPSPS
jgi:hypothetical protein